MALTQTQRTSTDQEVSTVLQGKLRQPMLAFATVVAVLGFVAAARLVVEVDLSTVRLHDPSIVERLVNSAAIAAALPAIALTRSQRVDLAARILIAYFALAWLPLMWTGGLTSQLDSLFLVGIPLLLGAILLERVALWAATAVLVSTMVIGASVDASLHAGDSGAAWAEGSGAAWADSPSVSTLIVATLLFAGILHWLAAVLHRAVTDERARAAELDEALEALMLESDARVRLERNLASTQRLDALGRLAGSVAHDFSNLVTGMLGALQLARRRSEDAEVCDDLDLALGLTRRAAAMTRSLVAFSSGRSTELMNVAVDAQLADAKRVYAALLPRDLTLDFELDAASATIRCAPHELEQIVLNLLVNSADALVARRAREAGDHHPPSAWSTATRSDITISTTCHEGSPPTEELGAIRTSSPIPPTSDSRWLVIEVKDRGVGMTDDVLNRVFDRQFTTKAPLPVRRRGLAADTAEDEAAPSTSGVRGGSGFGLSDVAELVGRRGGGIGARSEPGVGTTFRVWFPADWSESRAPRNTERG